MRAAKKSKTERKRPKPGRPATAAQQALVLPEPDARQRQAIDEARAGLNGRRAPVEVAIPDGSISSLGPQHSDRDGWRAQLCQAFGAGSFVGAAWLMSHVMEALQPPAGAREPMTNAALAIIDGASPKDELEAMLVGQMVTTHALAMGLLGRAKGEGRIAQFESEGNMAVKLLRTFTAQTEALAKLRRGGEQTVRVEHVHVYQGGQAVVGNVTRQRGGITENDGQPHAGDSPGLTFTPVSPLRRADPEGNAVPDAAGEREAAVPDARRRKGERRTTRGA